MDPSNNSSVQYTQFPTYRRSLLFRPSMTHSFTDGNLYDSREQEYQPFQSPSKRNPSLLHPSKHYRTPLKPYLSPQSPAPSSISRQSMIKDSESRLRKNLSDLESRRDDFSRTSIKSSSSPSPLSSSFLPHQSKKPSAGVEGKTPERNKHKFDNEILAIFLKNNGGYLDDSDSSDDEPDCPNQKPPRFSYSRSSLAGPTKQQIAENGRTHLNRAQPIRRTAATNALNRRSLSLNVL